MVSLSIDKPGEDVKLITRDTDYAIRALCFMAKGDRKITAVSELVKELKIPRPFLRKLLQVLNKKRLLKSYKGQSGGFELALCADKIFLSDLIKIFQGPLKLNECLFKKRICPAVATCALKKKIGTIEKYVFSELRSITIGDLLK